MRKRFQQQLALGQLRIEDTVINPKSKFGLEELCASLKEIYCNAEYNEKICSIVDEIMAGKNKNTGRPGMDLWTIFVLSQVRMCLNFSYEGVHNLANYHTNLRQIMGIERESGYGRVEFEYQQIYDNVSQLSDDMLDRINKVIVEFGHGEVFKKKENAPLRLKTDSFVVESNVHFPTDYNLLWDCARKSLNSVKYFLEKYNLSHWRKIEYWRKSLKNLSRSIGRISAGGGKNKQERLVQTAHEYINQANLLSLKIELEKKNFPICEMSDMAHLIELEHYIKLLNKHIDLVRRRIIEGETIPHEEKMFSIFEPYTEWINKGKSNPNVELGKKLAITTDQHHLIVDYLIMENQNDQDITIDLADKLLARYPVITSWSFDKGYWNKIAKELLSFEIKHVVMPKKGKLSEDEKKEEHSFSFKKLRHAHSAVESNINELEHRGLDRCPNRGYRNFKSYIGAAVCCYNLKKIGREILKQQREELGKIAA